MEECETITITPDIVKFEVEESVIGDDKTNKSEEHIFPDGIQDDEKQFYLTTYDDVTKVRSERLHCSSCARHLGSNVNSESRVYVHPILQVLQCSACHSFYNSGEFEKGEDGSELYCRWCGQGGVVYCCSSCPFVFCKNCILRNLSEDVLKNVENSDDWTCFRCDIKPILPLRAKCWALTNYFKDQKELCLRPDCPSEVRKLAGTDHSPCCRRSKPITKPATGAPIKKARSRQKNNKPYTSGQISATRQKKAGPTPNQNYDNFNYQPLSGAKRPASYSEVFEERVAKIMRNENNGPVATTSNFTGVNVPQMSTPLFDSGICEDEIVCTPDIFSCMMDTDENSVESPPPLVDIAPRVVNGKQAKPPLRPKISVRTPESMRAPTQFSHNPPIVSQQMGAPIRFQGPQYTLAPGTNNVYHLNDPKVLTFTSYNNSAPVQNIAPNKVGNAPIHLNNISFANSPAATIPANTSSAIIYPQMFQPQMLQPQVNTAKPATNSFAPAKSPVVLGLPLTNLNPNISRVRMRRVPDWFNLRIINCITAAKTFINQMTDLKDNINQMSDASYEDIKNLHIQLSFLMSTAIGRYKNNQHELNIKLKEWTDALCSSLDHTFKTPQTPAVAQQTTVNNSSVNKGSKNVARRSRKTVSSVEVIEVSEEEPLTTTQVDNPSILKNALGYTTEDTGSSVTKAKSIRVSRSYINDKKLRMRPVVVLMKYPNLTESEVAKYEKAKPSITKSNTASSSEIIAVEISDDEDEECQIVSMDPLAAVGDVFEVLDNESASLNAVPINNETNDVIMIDEDDEDNVEHILPESDPVITNDNVEHILPESDPVITNEIVKNITTTSDEPSMGERIGVDDMDVTEENTGNENIQNVIIENSESNDNVINDNVENEIKDTTDSVETKKEDTPTENVGSVVDKYCTGEREKDATLEDGILYYDDVGTCSFKDNDDTSASVEHDKDKSPAENQNGVITAEDSILNEVAECSLSDPEDTTLNDDDHTAENESMNTEECAMNDNEDATRNEEDPLEDGNTMEGNDNIGNAEEDSSIDTEDATINEGDATAENESMNTEECSMNDNEDATRNEEDPLEDGNTIYTEDALLNDDDFGLNENDDTAVSVEDLEDDLTEDSDKVSKENATLSEDKTTDASSVLVENEEDASGEENMLDINIEDNLLNEMDEIGRE